MVNTLIYKGQRAVAIVNFNMQCYKSAEERQGSHIATVRKLTYIRMTFRISYDMLRYRSPVFMRLPRHRWEWIVMTWISSVHFNNTFVSKIQRFIRFFWLPEYIDSWSSSVRVGIYIVCINNYTIPRWGSSILGPGILRLP